MPNFANAWNGGTQDPYQRPINNRNQFSPQNPMGPRPQPSTDPYQLPRGGKPLGPWQRGGGNIAVGEMPTQISTDPRYQPGNWSTPGNDVPRGFPPSAGPRPRPRGGPNTFAAEPYQIPMAPGQQQYNGPKIVPMTNTMTPIGPGGPTRPVPSFNPRGNPGVGRELPRAPDSGRGLPGPGGIPKPGGPLTGIPNPGKPGGIPWNPTGWKGPQIPNFPKPGQPRQNPEGAGYGYGYGGW